MVLAALLLILFVKSSFAMENHGLISVDDFYSTDSSAAYDRNILTTRFRLDSTKLDEGGSFSFHFDGRERINLGAKDYYTTTKNTRVDTLNVAYESKPFYLAVGRLWPKELPIEHVDGVNGVYRNGNFGVGFFGGFKPSPYADTLDTHYDAAGAYVLYNMDNLLAGSLAFVYDGFKGATDREYINGTLSYIPVREIRFFGTATADINQVNKSIGLTNAIFELSWQPDFTKSLAVGYTQFRAFQYFKSQQFQVDTSIQRSYYARASYRFLDNYNLYGRVERQSRDYAILQGLQKHAHTYQLGLSRDNLYRNINANGSVTLVDSYGSSKFSSFNIEASRLNWEVLQVMLNASYVHNSYYLYSFSNDTWLLGASAFLNISRRWSVSGSYEWEKGSSFTTTRLISRVTFKF